LRQTQKKIFNNSFTIPDATYSGEDGSRPNHRSLLTRACGV
jgi:hypothetical protein